MKEDIRDALNIILDQVDIIDEQLGGSIWADQLQAIVEDVSKHLKIKLDGGGRSLV